MVGFVFVQVFSLANCFVMVGGVSVCLLVQCMVAGYVEAEDLFAEVGDDAVAEGGDADGADIAHQQHGQKRGFGPVQAVECGCDHGAEDDVAWVEDGE